jgi:hypothetical protein
MKVEGDGYIACVLPKPENCDNIKKSFMSQEDYEQKFGK